VLFEERLGAGSLVRVLVETSLDEVLQAFSPDYAFLLVHRGHLERHHRLEELERLQRRG